MLYENTSEGAVDNFRASSFFSGFCLEQKKKRDLGLVLFQMPSLGDFHDEEDHKCYDDESYQSHQEAADSESLISHSSGQCFQVSQSWNC